VLLSYYLVKAKGAILSGGYYKAFHRAPLSRRQFIPNRKLNEMKGELI
jgi:hypothetical protein